ncbi:unnamed protein product [Coffea canephora]|uniref:Leucine-rich repeat-containing N-terminal plant-type domain-containing protein n=1 Tax=Coffea canephora TaxID=49390 RepID=A0A068UJC9_COFCA|nr:unnamed protein product [Coffea canephora]
MEKQNWLCIISAHLLILQSAIASSFSVHHLCHHDEGLALLQFKEQFKISASNEFSSYCSYFGQHPHPKITSWNESTDCCTWDGVTCHEITGHIIQLDLSCSQIEGVISPNSSLFGLSQLRKLNLAYNDFQQSLISHEFSGLTQLTHLNLSTSNFKGQIASEISQLSKLVLVDFSLHPPSSTTLRLQKHDFQMLLRNLTEISVLCLSSVHIASEVPLNFSSSLTYLDLSSTGMHGNLPDHVFEIPNMQALVLGSNENLTGILPKFNSSISSLEVLDLSFTNLFGELPVSIGCLKSLNSLILYGCQFSGSLPESIGNLSKLTDLELGSNNFVGQIPRNSFNNLQKLTSLSLFSNPLVGPLPPSVVNLTGLVELDIRFTSLSGPLPSNASGLQNLVSLLLTHSFLDGTLPSWLFHLPSVILLDLAFNNFTGQLPDFTGNSSLTLFFLDHNKLQGPIPKSISTLRKLIWLDLSSNNLICRIDSDVSLLNLGQLGLSSCGLKEFPGFIQNSKNLSYLDLSSNNIRQIPSWLPSTAWDSLTYLNLSYNAISTPFMPPWKSLSVLDMRSNQLQGPLPISICNLEVLFFLDMSENKFSGEIPHCFGNFSSELAVLNLKNNRLQGSIGMTFAWNNGLRYLGLQGNLFEGQLPRSLVKCEKLEVFDVGNNKINDTFPTWVENLKELQVLVLKSNRFFGTIDNNFKTKSPFKKLQIMDLSNNEFTGVVPIRLLTSLRAMMNSDRTESRAMYMGAGYIGYDNDYRYSLSISMKGLSMELPQIITTLTAIDLSSNRFSGEIDDVIGNLAGLEVLNLSHNRFSGHIPSSFGNLSSLESLDISCNQIDGEIPQQLTMMTSLEFLNLSQNHLVGRIPQGNQFNTFSNDSYKGNVGLCGLPLTKKCSESDFEVPPPLPIDQEEEQSDFFSGFTWKPVMIGYGFGIVLGLALGWLMFATGKPQWIVKFVEDATYKQKTR